MKILVTYLSISGNTEKVAKTIFQEIACDKAIKELKEVDSLESYDLVFVGFPIHAFGPAEKAEQFMKQHLNGADVALFITHASNEDSALLQEWVTKCKEAATDANVIGVFHCQGELAPDITELLLNSDDPKMKAFGEMAPKTKGQPDETRLERARAFATEMISIVT